MTFSAKAAAAEAARIVVDAGAVNIRAGGEPFFFTSGWASPVFIDVKRLIAFPAGRDRVLELALARIDAAFAAAAYDQIAGCELAGVPFAAMVADRRRLPLVVALKQARGFGRLSQCEGVFDPGARTLLIDDLTTDGRSKLTFKQALERAQAEVVGIFVFLNYGIFPSAPDIVSLLTLADVIVAAQDAAAFPPAVLEEIEAFAADAPAWSQRHGGLGRQ